MHPCPHAHTARTRSTAPPSCTRCTRRCTLQGPSAPPRPHLEARGVGGRATLHAAKHRRAALLPRYRGGPGAPLYGAFHASPQRAGGVGVGASLWGIDNPRNPLPPPRKPPLCIGCSLAPLFAAGIFANRGRQTRRETAMPPCMPRPCQLEQLL
eukprot:2652675-Rhodomonas_salina.2